MSHKLKYALFFFLSLAACGGGGDPEEMVDDTPEVAGETQGDSDSGETPTTPETPDMPAAPSTVTYSPATIASGMGSIEVISEDQTITLAVEGWDRLSLIQLPEGDEVGFETGGLQESGDVAFAVAHFAAVNGGQAGLGLVNGAGDPVRFAFAYRTDEAVLPVMGSATYSGGYLGVLTDVGNNTFSHIGVRGLTEFNVDFANNTFTGEINQREGYDLRTGEETFLLTFADVVVPVSPIDGNGFIGGSLQGGEISGADLQTTMDRGSFTALLTGESESSAVVGVADLLHEPETGFILETGIFQAKRN